MVTYLLLNTLFIALVTLVFRIKIQRPSKKAVFVVLALLTLTAVFDSLIVSLDIVGYDTSKILGVYLGSAPIEDFFYAILSAILVPTIWNILGRSHDREK
jgi:lycopene cyclase domain-containing protein